MADSRGGGAVGATAPYWLIFFFKVAFSVYRAYISLCAFVINEDGADKLSFALLEIFWIRHWGYG